MMTVSSMSDYALRGLPRHAAGTVHSVFSSSLNLEFGGRLLHVGSDSSPLSCIGVQLPVEETATLLRLVEQGDSVVLREGCARIYSRAGVSELDFRPASVRCMEVRPLSGALPDGADIVLQRELAALGLAERTGLPWTDRSQQAVSDLARFSAMLLRVRERGEALATGSSFEAAVRAMRGSVDYLVGRGLGLTPSGDDVLTGFGTGLRFLHGGNVSDLVQLYFDAVSLAVPGKTTAVSEAYCRAMVAGYANGDYLDLLEAVRSADFDVVPDALSRVTELGHTSGADSLLGFGAAFCCLL